MHRVIALNSSQDEMLRLWLLHSPLKLYSIIVVWQQYKNNSVLIISRTETKTDDDPRC